MYLIILSLITAAGIALIIFGQRTRRRLSIVLGAALLVATALLFSLLDFWGEMLWFRQLGYQHRFWKVILSKAGLAAVGAVVGGLLTSLLTLSIPKQHKWARLTPRLAGALLGAFVLMKSWRVVLVFLNRVTVGVEEPVLGHDIGFYLFSLPFCDLLHTFIGLMAFIALVASIAAVFVQVSRADIHVAIPEERRSLRPVIVPLAVLFFSFAFGQFLNRYHLMTSELGIVTGPGWTDVHIRMPGYMATMLVATAIGIVLLISPLRAALVNAVQRHSREKSQAALLVPLVLPVALLAMVWGLFLALAPMLAQWLRVEPNEITMEHDYIHNNIRFTRYGFGLDHMEEMEFPASEVLTRDDIDRNRDLMSEVRLWDWRALADVYEQFQEIRLYYTFPDVDIDRYHIGNDYRQVMISPREMDLGNLPADSRTFINERFKYTHGYGLTMSSVREFTSEGLPNLLIKDIPPKWTDPSLAVKRPQIYYGMLTYRPAVVNTKESEFDYPSGDENVYTRYAGDGGVQLSSLWRKFVFGWKFDGTRFLFSGYPTHDSRILFHRQIEDRVRRIAPFLHFESDPYIVLDQGRLYWIIDAYTTSKRLPYSERFEGVNYLRNSVKAVVDAFSGHVEFYRFDDDDPIIRVWQKVFPGFVKPGSEMPAGLRAHVRYPSSYLLTQSTVYSKYHMTDPSVFYNQEDLWVRATEKYYQRTQPVEPYYVMWKLPGTQHPQFVLILPFTPKNKQVLIGWMAGMCDGDNYGRLLAYKLPKEKRVLGPQQVETKIDQDRFLSGQLTLWDQRGSKVIRGNVLAIPIDDTLLYVEPIYLQAETAAYPELRLVAVMHDDNLSYGETFEEALEGLFSDDRQAELETPETPQSKVGMQELIRRAGEAFDAYLRLQGEGRFSDAADELQKLSDALKALNEQQD